MTVTLDPRPARTPPASPGTPHAPDVTVLVAAARRGDAAAWQALHGRYNRIVVAAARRCGLGPEQADDVAQTTWMRLVENIDGIRNDVAIPAWLVRTSMREAYALSRRSRREVADDDLVRRRDPSVVDDLDSALDSRRLIGLLRRAVSGLPARERCLLEALLRPDEPSYVQVSRELDMPIGAIGPVRQRAVRRLQAELSPYRDLL